MVVGLIIVCVLLALSVAFNFFLVQVLKNTLIALNEEEMGRVALHNMHEGIAYDGEYYHGNLLLQIEPNPEGGTVQIMDFSQYESHQLIGCTIRTNAYDKEWYNIYPIPNVVVFQPMEGVWTWKFGSQ